jgi:nucleoside-diphosphate-sugar epimerase
MSEKNGRGPSMPHLFCFGLGFSAQALIRRLAPLGWTISGTNRDGSKVEDCQAVWHFDGSRAIPEAALNGVTHLLLSVPPGPAGDSVLMLHRDMLGARRFQWVGYLSTTGVYGDRGGDWVDEDSPLEPNTDRGRRRLAAEEDWTALTHAHLFRLAGIYGPGRNQLVSLRDGSAKRIIKPGQVFSRIHVDDVAGVLAASIARPQPGRAYNVCDDEPAPPQDVMTYAAKLLGVPPPPEIAFADADLSPMARSFYAESKRVANERIKADLGYRLLYPTYREGLKALLATIPLPPAGRG